MLSYADKVQWRDLKSKRPAAPEQTICLKMSKQDLNILAITGLSTLEAKFCACPRRQGLKRARTQLDADHTFNWPGVVKCYSNQGKVALSGPNYKYPGDQVAQRNPAAPG